MLSDQRCQVLTSPPAAAAAAAAITAAATAAAVSLEVSLYRGVQEVKEEVGRREREGRAV